MMKRYFITGCLCSICLLFICKKEDIDNVNNKTIDNTNENIELSEESITTYLDERTTDELNSSETTHIEEMSSDKNIFNNNISSDNYEIETTKESTICTTQLVENQNNINKAEVIESYNQNTEIINDYSIDISIENHYNAVCYIAHIITSNANTLKTTFGDGNTVSYWGTYNIASNIASQYNAKLVINGDYRDKKWGADSGIIRNGEIVNNNPTADTIGITYDGNIIRTAYMKPEDVLKLGVRDTFYFGPILIDEGKQIQWDDNIKHPRTFIGQVKRNDDLLEYYLIVADGRQAGYSEGLTCNEMGNIMKEKGCYIAYNLDGGGSSTMVYNGAILNRPSDGEERLCADFIYIQ